MIIVLLLLFQSLCLYCQRLVLHIHDRCFPRNARLLQEVAETVGDRKALQHLEHLELEQNKRRQKRRILEPILPLGAGANLEACRFCAHSPQGYCRHHFHLQLHTRRLTGAGNNGCQGGEKDYKEQRRIRRELKRSLQQPRSGYQSFQSYPSYPSYPSFSSYQNHPSPSISSLSSGYASLSPSQQEEEDIQLQEEEEIQLHEEQQRQESVQEREQEQEQERFELITSHL